MDIWDANLVSTCWLNVKNCIFKHMTDKFFSGDRPPLETPNPPLAPKVETLEPSLCITITTLNPEVPREDLGYWDLQSRTFYQGRNRVHCAIRTIVTAVTYSFSRYLLIVVLVIYSLLKMAADKGACRKRKWSKTSSLSLLCGPQTALDIFAASLITNWYESSKLCQKVVLNLTLGLTESTSTVPKVIRRIAAPSPFHNS